MKPKDLSKSKKQPTYNLQECKDAVTRGNYRLSKKADEFIEDLDFYNQDFTFTRKDFEQFVNQLTPQDFSKTILYDNWSYWLDIYISEYNIICKNGEIEKITLYFKYHIFQGKLLVNVVSFHEDR